MANVFGSPVDNFVLEGLPGYADKPITRYDRATVALKLKNIDGKDIAARNFVEKLKKDWGSGEATLCMLYNATGDDVKFVCDKNWHGHNSSSPYPTTVKNGQWGAFLHVKQTGIAEGSAAAVVYRGTDNDRNRRDWFIGWNNPWSTLKQSNTVFCEVREEGHFENDWVRYEDLVFTSKPYYADSDHGCICQASTGNGSSPIVEALIAMDVGDW